MTNFATADTHWYHENILNFCKKTRGQYKDIGEMNEVLIRNWNDTVKPEDTVYHLGDVGFTHARILAPLLKRLNGMKVLIKGNHDRKLGLHSEFTECFSEIHDYLDVVENGQHFAMFHYPIWEWDQLHRGTIHLHGHVHAKPTGIPGKILDVGVDNVALLGKGLRPISFAEIIDVLKDKPIRAH